MITFVAIFSAATCVTMFALGFGLLIPLSGAVSALADLMGVACAMVVLGLLFGKRPSSATSGRKPDFRAGETIHRLP